MEGLEGEEVKGCGLGSWSGSEAFPGPSTLVPGRRGQIRSGGPRRTPGGRGGREPDSPRRGGTKDLQSPRLGRSAVGVCHPELAHACKSISTIF